MEVQPKNQITLSGVSNLESAAFAFATFGFRALAF
jgi:hypothetical protein